MILLECKIGDEPIAAFRDCTFEEAAFRAVELYCQWKHMELRIDRSLAKHCVVVEVSDPDSGVTRNIKVQLGVEMKWINPRQGVDY